MVDSRQCADMAKRVLSMYTKPLPVPKSNVNVRIKQFKDGKWGWVVYDGSLELSHSTRPYETSQDASDGAMRYLHYLGRHVLAALGYTNKKASYHGNYLEKI
nr:MAG TPA: alpha-subunit of trans-3-chloroacrylic acid dehalogenase [Caudoviricetes sp.]